METGTEILYGCIGGLIPDTLRFIKNRHRKSFPRYFSYPRFWVGLALLAAAGALTCVVLNPDEVTEALAYGFAAPEILSKLASEEEAKTFAGPAIGAPASTSRFSLRRWWSV